MSGIILVWTLAVTGALWWFARGLRWTLPLRIIMTLMAILTLIAATPIAGPPPKPPTQVVYRFDDHRYLELTGWRCEGGIYYIDTKRNIRGELVSQYTRVPLLPITHADDDGDFIFFPFENISSFIISKDHGKTFEIAHWIGSRPDVEEIKKITVINRQAFLEGKDGRLYMTSLPIGKRWGLNMVDPINALPGTVDSDFPEYQHLPKSVPPVKNYKGWTEMHCDPGRTGIYDQNYLTYAAWQKKVMTVLGNTIALPVTLAIRTIHTDKK
jgi:hypothetical protein